MLLMSRFMIKKQRDYSKKVREMSSNLMTFEVETIYNFGHHQILCVAPHYSKKMRWWQKKFKDISLKYICSPLRRISLCPFWAQWFSSRAFGYWLFRCGPGISPTEP